MKLSKLACIVVIPLLFELAIFGTLWNVFKQAEVRTEQARNASEILNHSYSITNRIYASLGMLIAYGATNNAQYKSRYLDMMKSTNADLHELRTLAERSPQQATLVSKETKCVQHMLMVIDSVYSRVSDAGDRYQLLTMHNQRKYWQQETQNYLQTMQEVMSVLEAQAANEHKLMQQSKRTVERVLAIGIFLSCLIAAAMFAGLNMIEAARKIKEEQQIKNRLLAMVSHDLRAPLTSTMSYIGMLKDGSFGPLNHSGTRMLHTVETSLQHVLALLEDLLSLAALDWRHKSLALAPTDLGVTISDAVDVILPQATARGVRIERDAPPEVYVQADETRLVQAFVNILINSVNYCPEGSLVRVKFIVSGDRCVVIIEDDGPGIGADLQSSLFDAFTRGKSQAHSTLRGRGLGLHLTHQIVELHQGTIVAGASTTGGACFKIELPIAMAGEVHSCLAA